MNKSPANKYGYAWITLGLFLFSLVGHWVFAWFAYVGEEKSLGLPVQVSEYLVQTIRDTFENWQSEFLQLIWQVCGLAFFYFVGSPQSKEGNDRQEAKLDLILKKIDPSGAESALRELETEFPKK